MKRSARSARDGFSDMINRAAFGKERVVVMRRGKAVAAVVSLQDLELLEAMENRLDLAAARAALAKHHASGGKGIPWSEVKQTLGL